LASTLVRWTVRKSRSMIRRTTLLGPVGALRITLVHAFAVQRSRFGGRRAYSPVSVKVRGVEHPLLIRPATSDLIVFNQIFGNQEYAPLDDMNALRLIVDAGANVGYSSAWFLSRFPTAQVIALEPDPGNAEMCRRNLEPYGDRARVLVRAVWSHPTRLTILRYGDQGDKGEWVVQVIEGPLDRGALPEHVCREPGLLTPSGEVDAIDMASVITMAGLPIDLLKMDIEGAERLVFGHGDLTWLRQVSNIAIELHGPQAREVFFQALDGVSCESAELGELAICRNIRPCQDTPIRRGG
jgi:FkbM family methyltransferase